MGCRNQPSPFRALHDSCSSAAPVPPALSHLVNLQWGVSVVWVFNRFRQQVSRMTAGQSALEK